MSIISNKKIIFTGPIGAGKTTAIQTMSNIPIVNTNENTDDKKIEPKVQTTVAMDYGRINIGKKEKIHLYGTPGQERFNFMQDVLSNGAIGLILLLDNSRQNSKQDLAFYINAYKDFAKGELVIGVTKMDQVDSPNIDNYREWLQELSVESPVFTVDARNKKDISSLVQALLYTLDPRVTS